MDLKGFFSVAAPWIGAALGGPLGSAAVTIAADALGLSDKTEEAIKGALAGVTPEQMAALRQADQAMQLEAQKAGYQNIQALLQSDNADRADARARETKVGDHTNRNLAYAIIGAFIAMAASTLLGFTRTDSVLAGTIIGYLSAKAEQVLSYYFGSTAGSAEKSRLLAQSQPPK